MERTTNALKTVFAAIMAIAALMAICFETGLVAEGLLVTEKSASAEFVAATVMELLTLCCVPLALRLFRFRAVASRLEGSAGNLLRFGLLRLLLLGVPMLANTLLYYMFLFTAFGYMAIILLLALAFVFPTASRCEDETRVKEEK